MQLFLTKDGQGNRTDRSYAENSIRKEWSVTDPRTYVEPTSRANLTAWVVPRTDPTTYPTVDSNPRGRNGLIVGIPSADQEDALTHLGFMQNASFIATRHGLCRFRSRRYEAEGKEDYFHSDLIPWGASAAYPNPYRHFAGDAGAPPVSAYTYIKPTQQWHWEHPASGCLPIFYMDQPSPFMMPLPGVIRNQGRYGDTVRSKFRELDVTITEFPMCGQVNSSGKWVRQAADSHPGTAGLLTMPERPVDRVRVIIFARKKTARNPDPGQAPLHPPLFPPAPAGAFREDPSKQLDQTWDTPSNGENVMRWKTSHPDSDFVVIEDEVLTFPPFKATGKGHESGTGAGNSSWDPNVVFRAYGTDGTITTTGAQSMRSSLSIIDADGIPHSRRQIRFKRTYKDMGNKVRWAVSGSQNTHEGLDDAPLTVRPAYMREANTNPSVADTNTAPFDLDMCDTELFITVLTGAYLELREIDLPFETPGSVDGEPYASYSNQYKRGWNVAPASVCHPAIVNIKTKWWYADEPLQGRPDQMRIVDADGADTGHRIVLDRADPYLPDEVPQTGP